MKRLFIRLVSIAMILLHVSVCAIANDPLIIASLRTATGSLEGVCLSTSVDSSSFIGGMHKFSGSPQDQGFVLKVDLAGNVVGTHPYPYNYY